MYYTIEVEIEIKIYIEKMAKKIIMLHLFNSLSRKLEPFKPLKNKKVGLYTCGPTVYNYVHLGNLRAYVFVDLLKRYLQYLNFEVKHVMNITDIDDKTIKASRENNQSLKEYTDFYLQAFLQDLDSLNIKLPDIMPKATEHVLDMVSLIKNLTQKGFTYNAGGSVYFKISKFKKYGQLAQLNKQDLKQNATGRLNIKDEYDKKHINDFVLWKAWQPNDEDVFWDTEIGKGRPGWHIECSAMAMKYLGRTLDIHCGGIDLVFPHHTNEIAQSEAATGKKFVNYWLHNAHLMVDNKRMAKSFNNFYTLKDIKKKKYDPLLLRIILLKTHYRSTLNFTFNEFNEAKNIAEKFINFLINLDFINRFDNKNKKDSIYQLRNNCRKDFKEALNNDLNISKALAAVFNFIGKINKQMEIINITQAKKIKDFIFEIDAVLGFIEKLYNKYLLQINKKIEKFKVDQLLKQREEARRKGNYEEADKLRKKIFKIGLIIEDTNKGYILKINNKLYE